MKLFELILSVQLCEHLLQIKRCNRCNKYRLEVQIFEDKTLKNLTLK